MSEIEQNVDIHDHGTAYVVGSGHQTIFNFSGDGGGQGVRLAEGSLDAPIWLLPERIRDRAELLEALLPLADEPRGVHVLGGLGACGKTTIALVIAQASLAKRLTTFWVAANDEISLHTALTEVAIRCGASEQELSDLASGRRFAPDIVWERLARTAAPWLLIFDNADDPRLLAGHTARPASGVGWLRPTDKGAVIVTSRWADRNTWGRFASLHEVGPLPADDAALVLLDEAGSSAGSLEDARALAERLGGVPLALRMSGRYLADPLAVTRTFGGYLAALNDRFSEVVDMSSEEGDEREALPHTWELSLEFLARERDMPQARMVMQLLSCLAPLPFPRDLLRPETLNDLPSFASHRRLTEGLLHRVLSSLHTLGLINAQGNALLVHQLVLDTVAANLRGTPQESGTWRSAISLLSAAAEQHDPVSPPQWPWWREILPHLWSLVSRLPNLDPPSTADAIELGVQGLEYLQASAAYRDAELFARQCRDLARATLGIEHPVTLTAGNHHARALARLMRWEEAEEELRAVIETSQRLLGPEHRSVLNRRSNLGWMLRLAGKLDEGEREYLEVYEIKRRVLGEEDGSTLVTRSNLASTLFFKGDLDAAENEYREIYEIRLRKFGEKHRRTLRTQQHIARLLREQGRLDESEEQFRTVLDKRTEVLGPEHDDTLITRGGLARVMHDKGDLDYAEREFRAIQEIRERLAGPQDRRTLDSRRCVGRVLKDRGLLDDALTEFQTVWELQRDLLGERHFETLRTRHDLAEVLAMRGGYDLAIEHFRFVHTARIESLGPEHPETCATEWALAELTQDEAE